MMFAPWLAVPWNCHRIHLPKMLSCLGWWLHTWLSRKECVCHCGFLPEVQQKSARQHRSLTLGKKKQPVQHDKTVQQFLLWGQIAIWVLRRIVYSRGQKAGEWSLWGARGKPIWFKSQKNFLQQDLLHSIMAWSNPRGCPSCRTSRQQTSPHQGRT